MNRFTKDKCLLKKPRADANRGNHVRKRKGGKSALPNNLEKGRYGKRKTKNAVSMITNITGVYKTCFRYGPGHSLKE